MSKCTSCENSLPDNRARRCERCIAVTQFAHLSDGDVEKLIQDPNLGQLTLDRLRLALADRRKPDRKSSATKSKDAKPVSLDARDGMTVVEQTMADILDGMKLAGAIDDWHFEGLTFHIAPRMSFKADFVVEHKDRTVEVIETKGAHIWEDSIKSFKAAAAKYRFVKRWRMMVYEGGEWRTKYDFVRGEGQCSDFTFDASLPQETLHG